MSDQTLTEMLMEDDTSAETPAAKTTSTEQKSDPEAVTPDEGKAEEGKEGQPRGDKQDGESPQIKEKKPRAQKRIEDLTSKVAAQQEQINAQRKVNSLPWQKPTLDVDENGEVSIDNLNSFISQQVKQGIVESELQRQFLDEFKGFQDDLVKTLEDNPELDKDKPEYDAEFDVMVQEMLENTRVITPDGQLLNPSFRVSKYVNKVKKLLNKAKTKGSAESSAKLAKSASEGTIAPQSYEKGTTGKDQKRREAVKRGDADAAIDTILFGD